MMKYLAHFAHFLIAIIIVISMKDIGVLISSFRFESTQSMVFFWLFVIMIFSIFKNT